MYRTYENPSLLVNRLHELKQVYQEQLKSGADERTIIDMQFDIADLEERINFAYQDQDS